MWGEENGEKGLWEEGCMSVCDVRRERKMGERHKKNYEVFLSAWMFIWEMWFKPTSVVLLEMEQSEELQLGDRDYSWKNGNVAVCEFGIANSKLTVEIQMWIWHSKCWIGHVKYP